jgi:hypothetical protein
MRRFLVKLALFWLIQAALFAGLYQLYVRRNTSYLAALRDKEDRLAGLPGQRIVLVGGSNLNFGIDSSIIERRTGRRVVNMGLFAALGLQFMLDEVRDHLRPGDVVVVCSEYMSLLSESYYLGEQMDWPQLFRVHPGTVLRHPPQASLVARKDRIPNVLAELATVVREAISPAQPQAIYSRRRFNVYGDVAGERERTPATPPVVGPSYGFDPTTSGRIAERLNRFTEQCRGHGVEVVLAFPVFPGRDYEKQADSLEALEAFFRQKLVAPILVGGREACLPIDRFFDTEYHLTLAGTRERTELLAERLARHLGVPGRSPEAAPAARAQGPRTTP